MIVTMHFGDGSFKEIEATASHPEDAVKEIKEWLTDNAWFEVVDAGSDEVLASETLQ